MIPLPHRISQAVWSVEWPSGAEFGTGIPLAKSAVPSNLEWPLDRAQGVLAALSGDGAAVPLDVAHQLLDSLETWTRNNRALLTWPPTPTGFANALVHSARANDISVVAVIASYPDFCKRMLDQARELEPSLPTLGGLFGPRASERRYERRAAVTPAPTPAEGSSVPAASTPAAPSEPAPSSAKAPAAERPAERSPRGERAPKPAPAPPAQFILDWVSLIKKEDQPALARQKLDQEIKSALAGQSGGAWAWFDRTVFPELAKLPTGDLELLVNTWPSHNRFTPDAPVEWVDQTRFWVVMRDAGPERREILANGGLANVVNFERTDASERFEMATKMFPFSSKKADLFRQRLRLWQSFGGDLDEVVAAPVDDVSLSLASQEPQTVRQWVEQHNDAEWDSVLESLRREVVVESEGRFRRGPGPR